VRKVACAVVAVVLALALAACSSQREARRDRGRSSSTSSTVASAGPVFTLTGRRAPDAESAVRPAVSVRIDDTDPVRARAGIDEADIIFEDIVGPKRTGMLAMFQSRDAASVGPVGAVQPGDPLLLLPLRGLFAHAGGSPELTRVIRNLGVTDVSVNRMPEVFRQRRDREPPNHYFINTTRLRELTPVDAVSPEPVFVFRTAGQPFEAPGVTPVHRITVRVGTAVTPSFKWDPVNARWFAGDGDGPRAADPARDLIVENVIVQLTTYEDGRPQLVGSGDLVIATEGKLARGFWVRERADIATRWLDSADADLRLTPGRTWVLTMPRFALIETDPAGLVPAPTVPPAPSG
jgi:hypothetical protein